MTIYLPHGITRRYMKQLGMLWLPWVRLDAIELKTAIEQCSRQHAEENPEEHRARAMARCAWKKYGTGRLFWLIAAVVIALLVAIPASAQTQKVNVTQVGGNAVTTSVPVTCVSGCTGGPGGGGTSSNFSATFPTAGTAAGASDGTNMKPLLVDASGYLKTILQNSSLAVTGTFWQSIQPVSGTVSVNVISGFALETGGNLASIKTNTDKIPALGQALAAASVPIVLTAAQLTTLTPPAALTNFANETGGNLAAIKTDVDKIPSQGQALAGASMPVVLPAAQITTLTPLSSVTVTQGTGTNLHVVNDAGSAVIGHVINDTGSTTAVTGNVASTVADGANVVLGAKADAKSTATDTTAITIMQVLKEISAMEQAPASRAVTNAGTFAVQATLGAGSAVVGHVIADTGSTTAVTQATGTNLHAVIDTGSTTAVTQATGSNLHVVVDTAPSTAVTNTGTFAVQATMTSGNPCTTGTLTGVAGATSGTALTQLVALSGTTKIYVCSAIFTSVSGTSPTISLAYGTGSACATGTVTFFGPTAAQTVGAISGAATPFAVTTAGQALCYKGAGTSPVFNYTITYVQQ